ncbi:MAG TPA: hypothetical protein VKT70_09935, partial [Stellaceae bacterium]|nr:hypothetical protein [Stellaceae bacterium]
EYRVSATNYAATFTVALGKNWTVSSTTPPEIFFELKSNDHVVASAGLWGLDTPLSDPRVKAIDLSDFAPTKDSMLQQGGLPARRIEGAAVSEGEKLSVSSLAIKAAPDAPIVQLTIWGPPDIWTHPDIHGQVEGLLASFRVASPSKGK